MKNTLAKQIITQKNLLSKIHLNSFVLTKSNKKFFLINNKTSNLKIKN
jgi:hypothetical protein